MDYVNYLQNHQAIPYEIFLNALKNNRFFHAYLLSGPTGTPLLEIAKYLTKCILSDEHKYLKETNTISERVDNGNYPDLIIIDGKKDNIKIDDIRNLEDQFSKCAIERIGIKIYIINLVENMASNAVNALLKFLEEPDENTYAFLTTENEYRVLPTIKSRTEIIHFGTVDQHYLIDHPSLNNVDVQDKELLSFFYNDPSVINELSLDEDYIEAKKDLLNYLSKIDDLNELRFFVENEIIKTLKTKPSIRFFIDLLIVFFKEALKLKLNKPLILNSYKELLSKINANIKELDNCILKLMNYRNELGYNLNTSLLMINLTSNIFESEKL